MSLTAKLSSVEGVTDTAVLKQPVYLQVPSLADITVTGDAEWTDYTALGGPYSIPGGGPGLKTLSLSTLTMHGDTTTTQWIDESNGALEIAITLELLLETLSPFQLLLYFTDGSGDLGTLENLQVTLRNLGKTTRFGEADTLYWDLGLTEWRQPLVKTRSTGTSRVPGVTLPTTHVLTATDTLLSLSEAYYGHREGINAIKARNGISKWGSTDHLVNYPTPGSGGLNVGSRITIPLYLRPEITPGRFT